MSLKGLLEEKQLGLDDPGGEFAVETLHLSHHCSIVVSMQYATAYARFISIKLIDYFDIILNSCLKSLRGNICDVEEFDVVLS